ncbi:MAG TPA: magnesium transporter [Pseudoclavibacter sp.]|nr:magnesium transporter [Pseudoclavibacter sp.]
MSQARVFVARLAGCVVFDPAGDRVGKVRDVVVTYASKGGPRVVGLVVEVPGRRHVFLQINRVTSIAPGAVITTGLINLRRFVQRTGEIRIIAEVLGKKMRFVDGSGVGTIEDVGIEENARREWRVTQAFMRRPKASTSLFSRGETLIVPWSHIAEISAEQQRGAQEARQLIASLNDMMPADLAQTLMDLPEKRMLEVAQELPDERLADVLQELSEDEVIDILESLADQRAAEVLDHMEPDDAADVVAQLPDERSEALLQLMKPEEADDVRMLLAFDPDTAGGLMTTEPIICSADTTVAEGLALIRKADLAPALATMICVTLPPYESPTGRFVGVVHFQRMLRYPPHERLGTLIDDTVEPLRPHTPITEVSRVLASYNLVSIPVIDDSDRLVGVVTVDDVLDHILPDDWRTREEV